ncbi:MAG TPA: hypothetical protein VK978_00200 [Candidatus Saccharimonadales bacterium]|nr:hypothetical protein [Candidatus Saccharimonadales bacterium]
MPLFLDRGNPTTTPKGGDVRMNLNDKAARLLHRHLPSIMRHPGRWFAALLVAYGLPVTAIFGTLIMLYTPEDGVA